MARIAFVLGNGPSLSKIKLDRLKGYDTYGCNDIYKKFVPTYLVAVDRASQQEILQACVKTNLIFVHNLPKQPHDNIRYVLPSFDTSGSLALKLAAEKEYDYIFMMGLDLSMSIRQQEIIRMTTIMKGGVSRFIRVTDETCYNPIEFEELPNYCSLSWLKLTLLETVLAD